MQNRPLALQTLTVARCARFDASCLAWLAPKLKDLQVFDATQAESCHTDAAVWCLAKHCRKLRVLLLGRQQPREDGLVLSSSSGAFLTDARSTRSASTCDALERLDVSYHTFVTGLGWAGLAGQPSLLTRIMYEGVYGVARPRATVCCQSRSFIGRCGPGGLLPRDEA